VPRRGGVERDTASSRGGLPGKVSGALFLSDVFFLWGGGVVRVALVEGRQAGARRAGGGGVFIATEPQDDFAWDCEGVGRQEE